jgi:SAP domain-containing ribonucleoprotein
MVEYGKMKNAELEALLKSRGLTPGGKKAEMVEKLTKDDEKKAQEGKSTAAPAKASASHPEDEIDWDDDEETTAASTKVAEAAPTEPSTAPAPAVEKAGGEGVVDNPQAVPNQVADVDPSTTADLSVKNPDEEKTEEKVEEKTEEKKEPPPNYARGLAASSIDEEIEKRKRRAAKFGLNIEDDEGLKKLERAKKFGETGPPKGLDEALPERQRKRGREGNDQDGRGRKERRGDRFGGRRGRGPMNGDRRREGRDDKADDKKRPNNGNASWMSEADRIKAEERKKKWATPAA